MSNTVKAVAYGGAAYFIYRGISELQTEVPDYIKEDIDEINQDVEEEVENVGELDDSTLQLHIVKYREKYSNYYASLDEERRKQYPTREELQSQFDDSNLSLEEKSLGWKEATQGLVTAKAEQEEGPGILEKLDGLIGKLFVGGALIVGALKAGKIIQFARDSYNWIRNNVDAYPFTGVALLATSAYWEYYNRPADTSTVDGIIDKPVGLPERAVEEPAAGSGATVANVPAGQALDNTDNWVKETVYDVLGIAEETVITITEETIDILSTVVDVSVEYLQNNILQVALGVAIILCAGALVVLTGGFGSPIAGQMVAVGFGVIGITASLSAIANLEGDLSDSVRMG